MREASTSVSKIWFALPLLIGGPDSLVWLVTGVPVIASLIFVYIINKLCHRLDEHYAERNRATDDESIKVRRSWLLAS